MKLCAGEPPKFCKTSNNLIVLARYRFPFPLPPFLWIDRTLKTIFISKFNNTRCFSKVPTLKTFFKNSIIFGIDPLAKTNWSFIEK